jgi:hypothetical protein
MRRIRRGLSSELTNSSRVKVAEDICVLAPGGEEFLGARGGAVVDGGSETIAGDVKGKILP